MRRFASSLTLCLWLAGCTVSFTHPGPGPDTGPDSRADVSLLPDVAVQPDQGVDAAPPADAGLDAAPPVPDGGCPAGTKECSATCVPTTDPATGCAAASCAPCDIPNATAVCIAGACTLGSCDSTYESCDGNPATGCEINLATDASNCGSCGHGCSLPHANMGCQNSSCQFLSCVGDYRDCDNNVQTNGCETNTTADNQNCGGCNVVCATGFNCSATACRCSTDSQCNTGGGGTCDPSMSLCRCPIAWCEGPCHSSGTGCQ